MTTGTMTTTPQPFGAGRLESGLEGAVSAPGGRDFFACLRFRSAINYAQNVMEYPLRFNGESPCSILAANVAFHLIDGGGLRIDNPINAITNGDHADHLAVLQHGQMANPVLGHQPHGVG